MTASASAFAPDWASPPGDTLRDVLNGRGLTVDEAAVAIGVPVREVERLLSGEAEITVGSRRTYRRRSAQPRSSGSTGSAPTATPSRAASFFTGSHNYLRRR